MSRPAAASTISRKIVAISVKAEMHVMDLHTTRKFVMATPTSVTHTRTDNKNLNVLMIDSLDPWLQIPIYSRSGQAISAHWKILTVQNGVLNYEKLLASDIYSIVTFYSVQQDRARRKHKKKYTRITHDHLLECTVLYAKVSTCNHFAYQWCHGLQLSRTSHWVQW